MDTNSFTTLQAWCSIFLNSWLRKMENQCYHQKSGNSLCFTWVSEVDIFFLNFPRFSWSAKVCHFTFFIFLFHNYSSKKLFFQSIELFFHLIVSLASCSHWLLLLLFSFLFFFFSLAYCYSSSHWLLLLFSFMLFFFWFSLFFIIFSLDSSSSAVF